jgi:hypothetical protein
LEPSPLVCGSWLRRLVANALSYCLELRYHRAVRDPSIADPAGPLLAPRSHCVRDSPSYFRGPRKALPDTARKHDAAIRSRASWLGAGPRVSHGSSDRLGDPCTHVDMGLLETALSLTRHVPLSASQAKERLQRSVAQIVSITRPIPGILDDVGCTRGLIELRDGHSGQISWHHYVRALRSCRANEDRRFGPHASNASMLRMLGFGRVGP